MPGPDDIARTAAAYAQAQAAAEAARETMNETFREALEAKTVTVRDITELTGLSTQRVYQIRHRTR